MFGSMFGSYPSTVEQQWFSAGHAADIFRVLANASHTPLVQLVVMAVYG